MCHSKRWDNKKCSSYRREKRKEYTIYCTAMLAHHPKDFKVAHCIGSVKRIEKSFDERHLESLDFPCQGFAKERCFRARRFTLMPLTQFT